MRISKRMDYCLRCHVDFSEFHLLSVIPKPNKPTAVLLAPRKPEKENAYFALVLRDNGHWFGSLESLLDTCLELGYINKIGGRILTRRYGRMLHES